MTEKRLSADALKKMLSPPEVALSRPPVTFHSLPSEGLLERVREGKQPDPYSHVRLTLRAEPHRQISKLHKLLSKPDDFPHLAASIRKVVRQLHGRALVAHEPGLAAERGLAWLVQEYVLRGLVHKALVFAPGEELAFWLARLNRGDLTEPFVPVVALPEDGVFPALSLVAYELLEQKWPEELNPQAQLIAVTESSGLRKRRSSPWRNLLALSPQRMFLQCQLPFEQKPAELHGMLALLGVADLPPAARLKRELASDEGNITPDTRNVLRPFLQLSVLRNTEATTPIPWATRQWRTLEVEAWPAFQRLRKQLHGWLQSQMPEADEEAGVSEEFHRAYGGVLQAIESPAALPSALSRLSEEQRQGSEWQEWSEEAQKIAAADPRIAQVKSLLREYPNARALLWSCHKDAAELHRQAFEELERPIWSPEAPDEALEGPALIFASDDDVPHALEGPIDLVVHMDIPWSPTILDARSHWLLDADAEAQRLIAAVAFAESPELEWLSALHMRFKPEGLAPGEMGQIGRLLPQEWRFPKARWALLSQTSSAFFGALSKQLLEGRKHYRRLRDLNQRLFLDDYVC